jgi:hypothetical protein
MISSFLIKPLELGREFFRNRSFYFACRRRQKQFETINTKYSDQFIRRETGKRTKQDKRRGL